LDAKRTFSLAVPLRPAGGGTSSGHVAVNSILRDWIKGQVTAVECGILSFEAVFFPYMLTSDGRPLIERVADLLPRPEEKVVALPAR